MGKDVQLVRPEYPSLATLAARALSPPLCLLEDRLSGVAVHLLPTAEPRMVVPLIPIPLWLIGQAFYRRSQASSFLFREDGFERSLDRLLAAVDVQQTAGGAGVAEQSSQDGGHVVARDLTPEGR